MTTEQERRFQAREPPTRRAAGKLSPIDIEGRNRFVEYSRAKDAMIEHTDIPECRWRQVNSNDKRRLRLNVIRDILDAIPLRECDPGSDEAAGRAAAGGIHVAAAARHTLPG